jgi:DNA-directed RNA polymerase alpha subunit
MTNKNPNFLSFLGAPAQRALLQELGITKLEDLSRYSKQDLLRLHGFGSSSLPKLESELRKLGIQLKE